MSAGPVPRRDNQILPRCWEPQVVRRKGLIQRSRGERQLRVKRLTKGPAPELFRRAPRRSTATETPPTPVQSLRCVPSRLTKQELRCLVVGRKHHRVGCPHEKMRRSRSIRAAPLGQRAKKSGHRLIYFGKNLSPRLAARRRRYPYGIQTEKEDALPLDFVLKEIVMRTISIRVWISYG